MRFVFGASGRRTEWMVRVWCAEGESDGGERPIRGGDFVGDGCDGPVFRAWAQGSRQRSRRCGIESEMESA